MTRSIPSGMSGILSELELNRPELITIGDLEKLVSSEGIASPARVVAARLREHGWLLATSQRGVWEFAPAEVAGAYSSADPLISIKAFALANPSIKYALTFQSAAWALGLADRVPSCIEVAFESQPKIKIPEKLSYSSYKPNLPIRQVKNVAVLPPESIVIHMVQRPSAVRSWKSAVEWLPDVAYEIETERLQEELHGRDASVWARTGYLLQGMRPDIAEALLKQFKPKTKVRFGTASKSIRNDERWKVADTLLPFDPRKMESVR